MAEGIGLATGERTATASTPRDRRWPKRLGERLEFRLNPVATPTESGSPTSSGKLAGAAIMLEFKL
jgi:hypothetical protein